MKSDRDKQEPRFAWGDRERQLALEHLRAVDRSTSLREHRPRYVCVILAELYHDAQSRGDEELADRALESIYHAEILHRELMSRGYRYPQDRDGARELVRLRTRKKR